MADPCRFRGGSVLGTDVGSGCPAGLSSYESDEASNDEEDIMSGTTITMRRVRPATVGLWVVQVLLASQFASAGVMKLSGSPVMVDMFAEIGAGQWLRYVVGVAEVAGGLGLLVAPLCGLAAVGLTALMAGAVITNVAVLDENPTMPAVYLVLFALIAWRRRERTAALIRRRAHAGTTGRAPADRLPA
jgi:uncharacterized membrane protein YphA (DoxX/SURF4 family)